MIKCWILFYLLTNKNILTSLKVISIFHIEKFQATKTCKYLKKDYTIPHEKEFLFLSLFEPEQKNNKIILYLHSLGSNKEECFYLINHLPK